MWILSLYFSHNILYLFFPVFLQQTNIFPLFLYYYNYSWSFQKISKIWFSQSNYNLLNLFILNIYYINAKKKMGTLKDYNLNYMLKGQMT